jgi:mxaA protein
MGLALLAMAVAAQVVQAQAVQLKETPPRTFGYQLGDLVERQAAFHLPRGLRLDPASLPMARPNAALELRDVRWEAPAWWRLGDTYKLHLRYQVLRSPAEPRLMDLPPVVLRFQGGSRPQDVRLDAVPILVSPLVPEPPPERNGFGAWQPDVPPPLIEAGATRTRLALESIAAVLLLGGLTVGRFGWPGRRPQRPFDDAWRVLRRFPQAPSAALWQEALTALHRALDRSHGQVLFVQGLDGFIAQRPGFAPLRADLGSFFERSRLGFFAPGDEGTPDMAWLKALCRRARALERDAA